MPADNRLEFLPWKMFNFLFLGLADSDAKPIEEPQDNAKQDAELNA